MSKKGKKRNRIQADEAPGSCENGRREMDSAMVLRRAPAVRRLPVLITGGAGFIGTNLAHHYLSQGQPVLLYDNLSRPGVERNLAWLRQTHGELVQIELAD